MTTIRLSDRQQKIVEIVRENEPITSEHIADMLKVGRATLRPDLAILTMSGILDARPRVGYFYSGKTTPSLLAEELRRHLVKDFKSVPVVVSENTTIYDAVVNLFTEDVGTLYVVSEDKNLEGVVSRKDLLKIALAHTDLHKMPVSVVMTRMPNIVTIEAEETVYAAARKIIEHQVDSLPIVSKFKVNQKFKLEVTGRISKTNITRLFVELGERD